jgi:hypothetical protein
MVEITGAPYPIKIKLVRAGHPNRPGTKLDGGRPDAVVWHGTGNLSPSAGDEMHGRYVGRAYETGCYMSGGKRIQGLIEAGSRGGRGRPADIGEAFRRACVHAFIDADSLTVTIPFDEATWHAGDRALPWDAVNKGQRPLARKRFANRQNYRTLSVELCMNRDWPAVLRNAAWFGAWAMAEFGLGMDAHLRHVDLTGKRCPAWLQEAAAWREFLDMIRAEAG